MNRTAFSLSQRKVGMAFDMESTWNLSLEVIYVHVLTLIGNTFEIWVQLSFVGLFLEKRGYGIPSKQSMYVILMFVFSILDFAYLKLTPNGLESLTVLSRVVGSILLRTAFAYALYQAPVLSFKRLSAITTLFSIYGISLLVELVFGTVAVASGMSLRFGGFDFTFVLIVRLLFLLLYWITRKVYNPQVHGGDIRKVANFLFILLFIILFAVAFWLSSSEHSYLWFVLTLFLVVVSILMIRLFYESAAKKQEQAKLLSMQNKLMTERMEGDKRLMDAVHQTRHDLHRHLDYVYSLLDEGRTDEAKLYIQQITKPVKAEMPPVRTGCPVMDTVLQMEHKRHYNENQLSQGDGGLHWPPLKIL